jgi:hypothetical protein
VILANPDGPEGAAARLGSALAAAGDVDGDGLADFVAGESRFAGHLGRVHYYRGARGGPAQTPTRSWTGLAGSYAGFGEVLAGGGDSDGDGFPEVVMGAPEAGRVLVLAGGAGGPAEAPTRTIVAPADLAAEARFGAALAVTSSR